MIDHDIPWEMFLRGAVAGLLLFHLVHLALPAPRPAARAALAVFTASVLAYVLCQQADVFLSLPRPLAWAVMALCVSSTAWLWLAVRALFDDDFGFARAAWMVPLGMAGLGLAAHLPGLPELAGQVPSSVLQALHRLHAVAMLGCTAAALWEVARGWRDDLVEPRRAARRWVVLGVGVYAAVALVVELALRGEPIGRLLPALHVAGIGSVTLALAVLVARRSLHDILGTTPAAPDPASIAVPPIATAEASPASMAPAAGSPPRRHPTLERLERLMTQEHMYRREGLTLTDLAQAVGVSDATLREHINRGLGYRNFNDFLHHYRLQEAVARLVSDDRPILTIALECGYGSIGPFNRAFKQRFGITPSEYRGAARLPKALPAAE